MNERFFFIILVLMLVGLVDARGTALAADAIASQSRTWKTVEELSPQELQEVDLATTTPRHPQIPYLPAEPYPFTAPYTAEEMGYRLMEFTQRPRWSCIFANVWGSISPQGVILLLGKSISFMDYREPAGVTAEFSRRPGDELYRYLSQNTYPPDAEGSQRLTIRYRTDHNFTKKEEAFMYSPSIRRVRHQSPGRRQDKFPNQAQTMDDSTGRDAWEFSWRFVGTDVLYHTVRFPVTRPAIILGNQNDGSLHKVQTSDLKLMGNSYPYYTADGGVECYVVEAKVREDWLPDYYAPRLLYWLEKHSFYPLRIEQYGRDGNLALIEVRLTEMFNPALGERGYGPLLIVYWDIATDIMSYNVRDNHRVKQWTPEDRQFFFNPDFMRRQWYLDMSVKSQVEVSDPHQFYLRPSLEEGKFPHERRIRLPEEVAARFRAQEAAGRLVFAVEPPPLPVQVTQPHPTAPVVEQAVSAQSQAALQSATYIQHYEQPSATTLR